MEFDHFLESLLSPRGDTRTRSEADWHEQETNEGVPGRVLQYASCSENVLSKRQLCMTLIKELIRHRWLELSVGNRQEVLLKLLDLSIDRNISIRNLAHSSIGMATRGTGFCNWSDLVLSITARLQDMSVVIDEKLALLDLLLAVIEDAGGSALSLYIDEILCTLLSFTPAALQRRSLAVFTSLVVNLARDEELSLIEKIDLRPWTTLVFGLPNDPTNLRVVVTSVKALLEHGLADFFHSWILPVSEASIAALESHQCTFDSLIVASEEGGIDEDDEDGIVGLVIAILNFFSVSSGSPQLDRLFLAIAPFLQITVSQQQEWEEDPNVFLASEDEDFVAAESIRLAMEGLVADWMDISPHIASTITRTSFVLIQKGLEKKNSENGEFWRYLEAGLFLASLNGNTIDPELESFASGICEGSDEVPPLLRARAYLVLAKFGSKLPNMSGMTCPTSAIVKFAATRAFCSLVQEEEMLRAGLAVLIGFANEDNSFYFGLDCLLQVTRKCPNSLGILGPEYHEFLLSILNKRICDPLATSVVVELVEVVYASSWGKNIAKTFAPQLHAWLVNRNDFELDVALELIELLRNEPELTNCIAILPTVADIGENTANTVKKILDLVNN